MARLTSGLGRALIARRIANLYSQAGVPPGGMGRRDAENRILQEACDNPPPYSHDIANRLA